MLPHHKGFRLRVFFCTKMPATLDQPYPSHCRREIKRQVRMLPLLQRFDIAFVMVHAFLPSRVALSAHPASGGFHDHLGPRVLRSGRFLLSLPSSLLRPDPPVSMAPADFPGALVLP